MKRSLCDSAVRVVLFLGVGLFAGSVCAFWCLSPVSCFLIRACWQWTSTWWVYFGYYLWLWAIDQPIVLFAIGFFVLLIVDWASRYASNKPSRNRPRRRYRKSPPDDDSRVAWRGETINVQAIDDLTGEIIRIRVKSA